MIILVLNSGSSSLKYQVRDTANPSAPLIVQGIVESIGSDNSEIKNHNDALTKIQKELDTILGDKKIDAVGHRIVHGGEKFSEPTLINDHVIEDIEELNPLAPLHNPANIEGMKAIKQQWPDMPQVAVFDTSFHQTMPEKAWRYALNSRWYDKYQVRRYGFHGTSYQYVTPRAAALLDEQSSHFNGVIAHLGNGASITAIKNGKSVDTSMGFTPLEGLVMGTRSGDVDPSILTFMERQGFTAQEVDTELNKTSGLFGLAQETDMRILTKKAFSEESIYTSSGKYDTSGDGIARTTLELAAYRVAKYIGAYHVACGGAQMIVFTGGIGENSHIFRALINSELEALGTLLDKEKNFERSSKPRIISSNNSKIALGVVPTDEESEIAQETYKIVSGSKKLN